MEWNDCEKCEHYKACYSEPKQSNQWSDDLFNFMVSVNKRDLCVNNGKRNFVDDAKQVGNFKN